MILDPTNRCVFVAAVFLEKPINIDSEESRAFRKYARIMRHDLGLGHAVDRVQQVGIDTRDLGVTSHFFVRWLSL